MHPLNDNDLDRLSREAAEQYDVDQNTSGWEALEIRLNKELPLKEEKERRRFLFWLFLGVLLAGGGLLWMMTHQTPQTIQVSGTGTANPSSSNPGLPRDSAAVPGTSGAIGPATVVPVTPAPEPAEPALPRDNNNNPTTVPDDATTGTKVPAPASVKEKQGNTTTAPADKAIKIDNTAQQKKQYNNTPPLLNNNRPPAHTKGKNTTGRNRINHQAIDPVQDREDNKKARAQEIHTADELKASAVSATTLKTGNRAAIQAPPLPVQATGNTAAAAKTPPQNKKDQKNRALEIGLVAGPDMSNVKFTDLDKAGINVGLQIGYRFSDRWSVNTGFIYTKKNYTAQGKDFTKSGWWRYTDIHTVQGYCKMFDIPLNLRYDFSVKNQRRWFVSAGASTYLMTEEYYDYDYTYNGMRKKLAVSSDSNSNYMLSILNFSAGFERALSKRMAVQVEPYFKFPMKGLGYGKLDISSYGIYFSVKYKLIK
jgi:hypothetical protein